MNLPQIIAIIVIAALVGLSIWEIIDSIKTKRRSELSEAYWHGYTEGKSEKTRER